MRSHPLHPGVAILTCAMLLAGCEQPDRTRTENTTAAVGENGGGFRAESGCGQLPDAATLKRLLNEAAAGGAIGGLFEGKLEWAAVVNRVGELCAIAVAPNDPTDTWAGAEAIAKAKAYTANAFSTRTMPLSTARLYTLTQPGHSLWGLRAGNPFSIGCLSKPTDAGIAGLVCGGTISFGGGLPLYEDGVRVGGLGVSGDTPCADHEIAKRVRNEAGLNPPKGMLADDIQYSATDGPNIYTHPLCPNTWRNGKKIGEEPAASGY